MSANDRSLAGWAEVIRRSGEQSRTGSEDRSVTEEPRNVQLRLTLYRANAIRIAIEREVELLKGLSPLGMTDEEKLRLSELEASLRTDF